MTNRVVQRYVRGGERITADIYKETDNDGNVRYWTDAEWYDLDDEDFDTLDDAVEFLKSRGFERVR